MFPEPTESPGSVTTTLDTVSTVFLVITTSRFCDDVYNELSKDALLRAQLESKENLVNDKIKHGFVTSGPTKKPAARLVGEPINPLKGRTSRNPRDTTLVQCWCHECTNAFLSNGVRYHHGRLIVPLTGSYNLYSSLSLRGINSSEEHGSLLNGTFFKHAIYRYNVKNGHDVELVSSVQPPLSANRAFSTPLLRLEHLHAGEEISVKISGIFERHVCTEDDFFGLHMI
ncbi:tumor necrosis factor-like [Dreissena polymorpha]|uniref:tumor necrosis factor-like n=1 Tax=Dreissena polymorpha TaxID=45954 RepID=UPI0022642F46|nr:tumor necrosis factor-like [Dreissena polymorpha]